MGIRISEMEEATTFGADDYVPIVTNGTNKKALGQKIKDFIASFFVSKSGDTMTGDLTVDKSSPRFNADNNAVTLSTATNNGVSNTTYCGLSIRDSNNSQIGLLENIAGTDGTISTRINSRNLDTSGNIVSNSFQVIARKNGTMGYSVSDPAAFRSAIGIGSYVAEALSQYVTCNDNTYTTIMSGISLAKGTWVICVGVGWAYSGTGSRRIFVTDSATSNSNIRQLIDTSFAATENQQLGISNNVSQVVEFTSNVTLYVKAYQHSGAALNVVAARFSAIRIA